MSQQSATFHVRHRPDGEPWTAQAAQGFVGREVRYGRMGKVGKVIRAAAVGSGRAVRLTVGLNRQLRNPDPAKFELVR